jgi:hypothetical protein
MAELPTLFLRAFVPSRFVFDLIAPKGTAL